MALLQEAHLEKSWIHREHAPIVVDLVGPNVPIALDSLEAVEVENVRNATVQERLNVRNVVDRVIVVSVVALAS